ncbi:hypothetical protein CHLNCDRAFT_144819 [Chlorella variabilis]|uniref:Amino acid transporter transmembrane domain-containing protein n=1 Tax=Chlorella variabilis TaxID=554065 RepID=E1ZD28_CHLVA|nr:hypothetical protein CHLNCDRAFT_144819 [Chlorella variabilis]EFN56345.1 hypothetical protein CHLNCDRAFT_144819 [Chlorella variabilis]|eukprot:XP_005848447.1 hypothetical protein CHLNCDRAFT_144819 [Chlorella variabilis]
MEDDSKDLEQQLLLKEEEPAGPPPPPLPPLTRRDAAGEARRRQPPSPSGSTSPTAPAIPRGSPPAGCSTWGGVSNLVVSAVGAGMLALPRALAETGVLAGCLLFIFVCVLTFFSASIIVRHATALGTQSYGELVRANFGGASALLLQLSIVTHVFGVMVVYLIIIQDMLVGSVPHYRGVLPELLHRHDAPWWLTRPAVAGALLAAVVCPLLVPRSLTAVARCSRLSVLTIGLLAATICGLAAAAVAQGKAAAVHFLPPGLGAAAAGGGVLALIRSSVTVLAVACLAMTVHFVLCPVQASLGEQDCRSMLRVLRLANSLCTAIYAVVAISGYLLFGDATEGDVLKNLTVRFASGLVPHRVAVVVINGVVLAYTFNLLCNFVWAVRENVCEAALGKTDRLLGPATFYGITAGLVLLAYALSVWIPSIYSLIAIVGATACVTFSYLFPGLLVFKERGAGLGRRVTAGGMLALGVCMAAVETLNHVAGGGGGG